MCRLCLSEGSLEVNINKALYKPIIRRWKILIVVRIDITQILFVVIFSSLRLLSGTIINLRVGPTIICCIHRMTKP